MTNIAIIADSSSHREFPLIWPRLPMWTHTILPVLHRCIPPVHSYTSNCISIYYWAIQLLFAAMIDHCIKVSSTPLIYHSLVRWWFISCNMRCVTMPFIHFYFPLLLLCCMRRIVPVCATFHWWQSYAYGKMITISILISWTIIPISVVWYQRVGYVPLPLNYYRLQLHMCQTTIATIRSSLEYSSYRYNYSFYSWLLLIINCLVTIYTSIIICCACMPCDQY